MTNVEQSNYASEESELYGSYDSENAATLRKVTAYAWPIIRDLLRSIPFAPGRGPFVICDYGTADGVNSITLIANCIDNPKEYGGGALRVVYVTDWVQKTYGENQQVHIIYEDQQTNDFNSLIRLVEGGASGSQIYLRYHKNVFVTCCGRNFYKQCLPDATVHLGICLMAVMWLSECPRVTSSDVFPIHFEEGSPEQRMFMAQSAHDWETFLLHRAKELVPGGRLVVATLDRATCPCTNAGTGTWCLFKTMTTIWGEMVLEETITEEEFHSTIEPSYWQKPEYLSALFDYIFRVKNVGLHLVALETQRIKCAWRESWLMSNKQDDNAAANDHAVAFVQSIRIWSNRIFSRGLSKKRNGKDRNKILDELYRRLVDQVAMAPADRYYDYVSDFLTVTKTNES